MRFTYFLFLAGLCIAPICFGAKDLISCESRFEQLAAYYKPDKGYPDIPKKILVDVSRSNSNESFRLAYQAWQNNFKPTELAAELQGILSAKNVSVNGQTNLKKMRKFCDLLRAAFDVFSADHEAPSSFADFVADFGHVNDDLAAKSFDQAQKDAKKLLKALSSLEDPAKQFNAAKRGSVNAYLQGVLKDAQTLSTKAELSAPKFHRLRKDLKKILAVARYQFSVNPSSENEALFQYIYQLNEDMGDKHDAALLGSMEKDSSYAKTELKLNSELRAHIDLLLKRIQFAD